MAFMLNIAHLHESVKKLSSVVIAQQSEIVNFAANVEKHVTRL